MFPPEQTERRRLFPGAGARHDRKRPPGGALTALCALLLLSVPPSCTKPLPGTDFQNLAVLFNIDVVPAVSGTSPADGATNVAVSDKPAVIFNRPMDSSTLTVQSAAGACTGSFQISADNFTSCIGGTISNSNNLTTFIFTPASTPSASTTYRMKVTTAAADTEATPLPAEYTHVAGFTTAAIPAVASLSPVNGAINVPVNSTVQFSFNKAVASASVFSLGSIGVCIGATVQLSPFAGYTLCLPGSVTTSDNQSYTLTPSSPLPEGVPLYLRLSGNISDTSSVQMGANLDTSFTPYTPMNTGGATLQVWLKAGAGTFTDAGTTAANNGDTVQQWNDQTGNNNHAVQLTGVNKPRLVTGILNGQSVIRFDGVPAPNNDFLDLTTITADPEVISFTLFYVHQNTGIGAQALLAQRNGTGLGRILLEHKPGDRHGSNLAGSGLSGTALYTDNAWIITSMVWDRVSAAAGTITLYQNGTLDGTSGSVDPDAADGIWRIGVSKNGTGAPFNGRMAEILMYNSALSAADRRRVECYLGRKYGLTVTGHTCN